MFISHWWHPCQKNLWSWRLSIRNTSASWRGSDCEETVDPVSIAYGSPWFSSLDSWMGPLRADSWELFHIEIHQTPTNSPVNAYNFIRQSDKVSLKPTTHATEKKRPVEYLSIGETKLSIQFLRSAMRGHSPQRLMLGQSSLLPHSHAGKAEFQPKSFP